MQERNGTGTQVTKQFYPEGEQRVAGNVTDNYYYTRDHLGSIREVTDENSGLIAKYDYDAWGNAVTLTTFGYAQKSRNASTTFFIFFHEFVLSGTAALMNA